MPLTTSFIVCSPFLKYPVLSHLLQSVHAGERTDDAAQRLPGPLSRALREQLVHKLRSHYSFRRMFLFQIAPSVQHTGRVKCIEFLRFPPRLGRAGKYFFQYITKLSLQQLFLNRFRKLIPCASESVFGRAILDFLRKGLSGSAKR